MRTPMPEDARPSLALDFWIGEMPGRPEDVGATLDGGTGDGGGVDLPEETEETRSGVDRNDHTGVLCGCGCKIMGAEL